jgi:hypothetical protein
MPLARIAVDDALPRPEKSQAAAAPLYYQNPTAIVGDSFWIISLGSVKG